MRKELVSAYVSLTRRNAINARKRMKKTRNGAEKDGWSLINVKEARKELDVELLRDERGARGGLDDEVRAYGDLP